MKKLLYGAVLSAMVGLFPVMAMAAVDINIGFSLPPPVVFQAAPEMIVLPDSDDVYAVPDMDVDMYFWNGWWWRLWEGRWYRSHYYDRGWGYYDNVPTFYFDVDPGWRGYYRDHNWYGHRWNYERVPYNRLEKNWKTWRSDRHWEKQGHWGIEGYKPRAQQQRLELRREREQQYHQRPEVQRHQQLRQERQKQREVQKPQGRQEKQPQVQQPRQQPQERGPQRQEQRHEQKPEVRQPERQQRQGESQHQQPQERPQGGEGEHRK
jgi:hypothetical protein